MKFILSVVIFILSILRVSAQDTAVLEGKVVMGGMPVADAEVTASSDVHGQLQFTTRSSGDGTYRLVVPAGRYHVFAKKGVGRSAFGCVPIAAEVRLGSVHSVNLELTLSDSVEEQVTISADQVQPIDEVSKTVNIISGQEMRERADFALVESLRSIPGFRIQQLGGFGRTATIKTRGLRNQDTAVLIDGVRLRDPSAITGDASPFLGDLTLTSVSRVEVLRGSGSSLYGTNAIGGTVDLQTPLPRSGPHGQISHAVGGLGLHRFRGNFADGTEDGKFGFNIAAARTVYLEGIDGEDDAHNTNFQSRVEYRPLPGTSISGRFFVSDAFVRLNANPETLGDAPLSNFGVIDAGTGINFIPDINDPLANQKSKFFNGHLVVSQSVGDRAYLRGYYSGLRTSRKNDNSGLSLSLFDGTIHTGNATWNWAPGRLHDVSVGYEFESESFGNEGLTPSGLDSYFTRASQSSSTIFVQDVLSLLEGKLQLAGSFRGQFFDLGRPEFSLANAPYANLNVEAPPAAYTFDVAASYFIERTRTKLRTHAGNGYRVPSLYERYGTFFSTFADPEFVALGDPRLKPEKSIAFDSGVEQYFAGGKVKLSAVYFYTKLIDTIGFGNIVEDIGSTHRPFGGYVNQNGGIARGGEFSAALKPGGSTDIFASYTLTNSDLREPQVFGTGVIDALGIPNHQFTLVATQRIGRLWVNADVLMTSDYLAPIFSSATFNTYVYRFGGHRRIDLTSGYTFPLNDDKFTLRLFGTVENLLDQEYFESGFRTPARNGRVGASFGF